MKQGKEVQAKKYFERLEVINFFLTARLDINQRCQLYKIPQKYFVKALDGFSDATPLLYAVRHASKSIVKLLLEHGADPDAKIQKINRTGIFTSKIQKITICSEARSPEIGCLLLLAYGENSLAIDVKKADEYYFQAYKTDQSTFN
jgi:ankyrin repeat protein